jgi:hypothetical protein
MKIELFYIADCPNYPEAARLLKETLREFGSRDEVFEIEVTDSAQADALAFIGSPSIRIEGKDVESIVPPERHSGLSCRTYQVDGKLTGVPPLDLIRAAISNAIVPPSMSPEYRLTLARSAGEGTASAPGVRVLKKGLGVRLLRNPQV